MVETKQTPPLIGDASRTAAMLAVASVLLSSAALYNGFPLLYADSIDYLIHGDDAARVLLHGEPITWWSTRSFFYALAILPLQAFAAPWPIVGCQAVLTAYVLWLTMRTLIPGVGRGALIAAVLVLSALTSAPWFVGYVMPDIFTPLLVLGVYLLAFGWDRLGRASRAAVVAVVWFAIVAHASHLLLAASLVIPVVLIRCWQGRARSEGLRSAGRLVVVIGLAALSTALLHRALLGEASISGRRPVFLLARVLEDGTGRRYLEAHCGELDLAVCGWSDRLPTSVRETLWAEGSLWHSASPELREQLREQEMAVVLGAVRSHPLEQLRASLANFRAQLTAVGLQGSYSPDPYIEARIADALPGAVARYSASRQARRRLHAEDAISRLHRVVVVASVLALLAAAALRGFARREALLILTLLIAFAVLANAGITGVLVGAEQRYQSRIAWLLPWAVCLLVAAARRPAVEPAEGGA